MKSPRALLVSIILVVVSMSTLYACGGDTPVPPTATPPPPTATPLPPTPTTQPTRATQPTTSSSGGSQGTSADLQLIMDAVTTTAKLRSYHYSMQITSAGTNEKGQVDGDFVAPNKGHVTGTIGGTQIEQLIVGDKVYTKDASGKWVERSSTDKNSSDPTKLFSAENFTSSASPIDGLNSLLVAATDVKSAGDETMNGASVRHYTFQLDLSKMGGASTDPTAAAMFKNLPPFGNGEVWVDPGTKYVHKLKMDLDLGAMMAAIAEAMASAMGGTPTPGGPTATAQPSIKFSIDMNVTKHNDPSITVPDAPASTGTSSSTDTPSVQQASTPETTATTSSSTSGGSSTPAAGNSGPTLAMGATGEVDGMKVTVNKVRYTNGSDIFKPKEGSEFMILDLTFENTTSKAQTVSSILEFTVADDKGKEYTFGLTEDVKNVIDGEVPANGKRTGESPFEVDKSAKGLTFTYKPILGDKQVKFKLDR